MLLDKGGLEAKRETVLKLLQRFNEFNEWVQYHVLELVAKYNPADPNEALHRPPLSVRCPVDYCHNPAHQVHAPSAPIDAAGSETSVCARSAATAGWRRRRW